MANPNGTPWWRLSPRTKAVLAGAAFTSILLCMNPWMLDLLWFGTWWMLDFRLWPAWYFAVLIFVLISSLYWFRCYVGHVRGMQEKPRHLRWSLAVALILFVFTAFHRLSTFPLI